MRLARREFHRVFSRRWMLLWFFLLLGLGLWVSAIRTNQQFQKLGVSLESYIKTAGLYEGMPLEQAVEQLEMQYEETMQLFSVSMGYQQGFFSEEETVQFLKDIGYAETDLEALDAGEISTERITMGLVLREMVIVSEYDSRLKELQQGSSGLSGITLFEGDPYVARVREKAKRDYSSLSVSVDSWHHNTAVRIFFKNRVMDGFGFLFLLTVVLLMYTDEREKGYTMLISTTARGREKFWFGKSIVLFGTTVFVTMIYESALLLYYVTQTGDVSWGLPVQFMVEFGSCPQNLMIWQAVLLSVLLKIILSYMLLLTISAIACLVKKNIYLLSGTAVVCMLAALWIQKSGVNSRAGWLTCLNPLLFSDGAELLLGYQSFSFFGYPLDRVWIVATTSMLMLVLANVTGSRLYGKAIRTVLWRFPVCRIGQARKALEEKWRIRKAPMFVLELKKLLLSGKLFFPLLGIALFGMVYYLSLPEISLSPQAHYYQEYMWQLNGPLTDEKEKFLEQERVFFLNLEELQILLQEQDDPVLRNYIESMLIKKAAFEQVEEQYYRIVDRDSDGVFLYETGYLYLLRVNHDRHSDIGILVITIILSIFIPCFCWVEYRRGAAELVRTTAYGRSRLRAMQYGVYLFLATLMVSCIYGGDTMRFLRQFGFYGLNEGLDNLEVFSQALPDWSLGTVLFFIWFLRFVGVAFAVLIVVSVMHTCKDYLKTVLTCSIVIALPCFLYLLGFSFLKGYFLNSLLWGNEILLLWRDENVVTLFVILLQGSSCLFVCGAMMKKEAKRR